MDPPPSKPGLSKGEACAINESVEEELVYEKLPKDIAERHVLLMDPILGTGNTASRAIQVKAPLDSSCSDSKYRVAFSVFAFCRKRRGKGCFAPMCNVASICSSKIVLLSCLLKFMSLFQIANRVQLFMLLQVLLSKGVEESKILFLTLIAAPEGIHRVCEVFPQVKIVTSEIDEGIGKDFQVYPGKL